MSNLTGTQIRLLGDGFWIKQEGLLEQPFPAAEFRGYRVGTPGGGCHLDGQFRELPQSETDRWLNRRPYTMVWEETPTMEDFHTSKGLFTAVREGKEVVLFHIYEA